MRVVVQRGTKPSMEGVENEEEPLTLARCVLERGTQRVLL